MAKDFIVTVHDPQRAAEWMQVYGSTSVCVRSFIPEWANLPGRGNSLVYMLDLNELTAEQRQRLIAHLSQKFDIPMDEVAAELEEQGVPLLAEGCTVTVEHPQRWLLPDDIDLDEALYADVYEEEDEEEMQ